MKILVTGGAGFIGSHLVDYFVSQGDEVVIVDDLSHGHRQNLNPQAKFYKVDITSQRMCEIFEIERPDVVSHQADYYLDCNNLQTAMITSNTNLSGALNILEWAKTYDVQKIIYASSYTIYGNSQNYPCTETDPLNPINYCAVNHLAVEYYLRLYHQTHGLDFTVLRYPLVYGPRQGLKSPYSLVARLISQVATKQPALIEGSGKQELDLAFVRDIVMANVKAMSEGGGQIINLGSNQTVSANQLLQSLKELVHYPLEPIYIPAQPGYIRKILLDTERAEKILGWQPQTSLAAGLSLTLAACVDHLPPASAI